MNKGVFQRQMPCKYLWKAAETPEAQRSSIKNAAPDPAVGRAPILTLCFEIYGEKHTVVVGGVNGHHYFLGFVSKLQEHKLLEETHFFVMENKTKQNKAQT